MSLLTPAEPPTHCVGPAPTFSWEACQPVKKTRKIPSTRYVRTWTDDEEAFLIQSRRHKMPYKDISLRLRKTELACRLHYHQMVSSRRRSNTNSMDGSGSYAPIAPHAHQHTTDFGIHNHGKGYFNKSIAAEAQQATPRIQQPCFFPPVVPPRFGTIRPPTPRMSLTHENIDLARLSHAYEEHRKNFWTAIAQDYQPPSARVVLSPFELEAAFLTAQSSPEVSSWSSPASLSTCPTTPGLSSSQFEAPGSPKDIKSPSVHSPRPNRCTVSALLNDQDVSPGAEQSLRCFLQV